MASPPSRASRAQGSLLGVCIADALGGPVQFRPRDTFPPVTGYRYIAPFDKPAGAWSDDGSLTLILAQSLLDNAGVYTPADAAAKMVAWLYRGYLSSTAHAWDEGNATATALGIWAATLDGAGGPVLGDNDVSTGLARVQSALGFERFSGNGSLMRVAPIGLLFWDRSDEARRVAAAQSGLTHPFVVNGEACALYVEVLGGIMRGESKSQLATLAQSASAKVENATLKSRMARYTVLDDWAARPRSDIKSSGWVVDTLEAALWIFFTTNSFEEGVLAAANLGDDADTVAATYGGLGGAFYGLDALPETWRRDLVKSAEVHAIAETFAGIVP